jgi:hypothetical protein
LSASGGLGKKTIYGWTLANTITIKRQPTHFTLPSKKNRPNGPGFQGKNEAPRSKLQGIPAKANKFYFFR